LNKLQTVISWIPPLLNGARITVSLTFLSVTAGLVLGFFIALGKISKRAVVSRICGAYVFFFRGTPLLMQLYFIYYALPMISGFFLVNTGHAEADRFIYAFIAYSLNAAAYCAEIIRAAIQSIDKGQFEAGRALGLSYTQVIRLVIVPQSLRRLIPPVGNEFIMMLKDASLVSMIALVDITKAVRNIESSTRSALVYAPALVLYLIITAAFSFVFHRLEKKYSSHERPGNAG
jgi:polar amino acid transport system permease protein